VSYVLRLIRHIVALWIALEIVTAIERLFYGRETAWL
jgi:hypothetical protein